MADDRPPGPAVTVVPGDRVLIVDTPARDLWPLAARLRVDGFDVVEVSTTREALTAIAAGAGALLVHGGAGVDLPALLAVARHDDPDVAVIVVGEAAPGGPLPAALADAVRVSLPPDVSDLGRRLVREIAGARTRRHLRAFQRSLGPRRGVDALIGASDPLVRVRALIGKLAASVAVPTLVHGAWGTGHGLVARVLHDVSDRWSRPFIRFDCSVSDAELAERLGAGSGGARVLGDEATTYLEHVELLTPSLQAVLLQALEQWDAAGEASDRRAGRGLITSTTVDLGAEVEAGRFRRDLYYRLSVARIDLAPLRHRGEDVLLLAAHFAAIEGAARRHRAIRIDEDAARLLTGYGWPGNVRELRHVMARAVLLSQGNILTAGTLSAIDPSARSRPGPFRLPDEGLSLDTLERQFVIEALDRTGGNQTRAAELLGLHRDQIRYRMRKYGLRR